ncbi:MAG: DUF4384 domain-containing protein [Gemmatimonadales bacterium]|nr:DUF4384 domain-containing protein [Gemmatimonadales bacterium]
MFTPLLFALAVVSPSDRLVVGTSTLGATEPPVRIWLNGDRRFEPGDGARVQVEARDDGYLLVLNFDTEGRVRVLFPLDPSDDGFVRGGRRYEVRTDRERNSFNAGAPGSGFVYVALAPDPWRLRDWARGNAWDYDRIWIEAQSTDPERDLTRLVEGASSARGFDYDLLEYFVDDVEIVRYEYQPTYFSGPGVYTFDPTCDPYWSSGWYCGARTGVLVSYGRYYGNDWWSIGYGPSWYWPSRYGYYYRPYSYGRGSSYYTYYRPWIVTGPTYRPGYNGTYLAGRSRDYVVGTRGRSDGFRNTAASGRPVFADGDDYRSRPETDVRARPTTRPSAEPESRGRPAVDRSADGAPGRARPATGGATRPDTRPAAERPSTQRAPTSSRPSSANPPTRARTRPPQGDDGADTRASSTSSRVAPAAAPDRSTGRSRPAATPNRSEPVRAAAPAPTRRVTSSSASPARSAPAPARAAPRSAPPPKPGASKAPPARSSGRVRN